MMIGFLRKDVAVALLEALTLTPAQLTITALILTLYFPCAATFAVIMRELGLKDTLKAIGIMLTVTLLSGTFLSLTLDRLLPPQALVVLLVAASIVLAVLAAKKNDPEDFEDFPGT